MNTIPDHIEQLRKLLPALRNGEIFAIEFGNPKAPLGFMSHHYIQYINTPAGVQCCFKLISRGQLGSGMYMGNPDDRDIEIKAQHMLEMYFKPTPLQRLIKASSNSDKVAEELCYFAITD